MSGITGWVDWEQDLSHQEALLSRMASTLAHRGPDASMQWCEHHAAFAHRHLAIHAGALAAPPIVYEAGGQRYALVCDSALLNARELRRTLEVDGAVFQSTAEAEVIIHAYRRWGATCVEHLDGAFAFALWDAGRRQLMLARDRLGIRPLFYARRGAGLLFGSELKALLAHPAVQPRVDAQGLAQILTFVRTPGSGVYQGIDELPPAHIALCTQAGFRTERYWALQSAPHSDDLPTTIQRVQELLRGAVDRQLDTAKPVAIMLSGGLDSSIIAALAAQRLRDEGQPVHTYSIDFVDSSQHFEQSPLHLAQDEPWARRAADQFGTTHHSILVEPAALIEHLMVQLTAHDLPMVGQMNTSLYLLMRAMKPQASVTLSGEAADEIFGGYPWLHHEAMMRIPSFPWLPAFLGQGDMGLSWLNPQVAAAVRPMEHVRQRYEQTLSSVPRLDGEEAQAARRREMAYVDLCHWLPFLLERKDRMGMAAGIETRHPFGDHRLVEYAWNIPWAMKHADGLEKHVLRQAFGPLLPPDIRDRKKSAYPSTRNPAYDSQLRAWARQITDESAAPISPLIAVDPLRSLIDQSETGRSGIAQVSLFERIILINTWMDQYHVTLDL